MVFIRVDGANIQEIGMGHLYRMIFLADQLHQNTGISPMFVISGYQETKDLLHCNNLKYIELNNKDRADEILKLTSSFRKDMLLIDMLDREDNYIKKLAEKFIVISFDDTEGGARCSDVVFNALSDTESDRENCFYGIEYFLIRPEIAKYSLMDKTVSGSVKKILICLGGSDPCSINLKMIERLNGLKFSGKVEWVLGPSVNNKDLIIERFKNVNLDIIPITDYKDMGKLYYDADLCICAAGFSLFEIACVGLPAITICLYPHQIPTAKKFEEKGCTLNFGHYKKFGQDTLKNALLTLIDNRSLRSSMSRKGKAYVDGLGIERVMEKIDNYINLKMGETI